jgi:hypothetical protein
LAEPTQDRAHDAYHRFFGKGAWSMPELWRLLAQVLVTTIYPQGDIPLNLDDTLFHKSGRKNQISTWRRDAVRSAGQKVVHDFGLNLVVLTLAVKPLGVANLWDCRSTCASTASTARVSWS